MPPERRYGPARPAVAGSGAYCLELRPCADVGMGWAAETVVSRMRGRPAPRFHREVRGTAFAGPHRRADSRHEEPADRRRRGRHRVRARRRPRGAWASTPRVGDDRGLQPCGGGEEGRLGGVQRRVVGAVGDRPAAALCAEGFVEPSVHREYRDVDAQRRRHVHVDVRPDARRDLAARRLLVRDHRGVGVGEVEERRCPRAGDAQVARVRGGHGRRDHRVELRRAREADEGAPPSEDASGVVVRDILPHTDTASPFAACSAPSSKRTWSASRPRCPPPRIEESQQPERHDDTKAMSGGVGRPRGWSGRPCL